MSGRIVACTIVSKNYLPYARVLARSLARHEPDARMVVLLVDRVDGLFDPAIEPFELIEVESLGTIPDWRAFAFKYGLLEINTAVKPFLLARLLAEPGVEKLVYFDPDIAIYQPLVELSALLDRHSIVLTPHLTAPLDDDRHPSELSILQAGAYNLGFLALSRSPEAGRMLAWWQARMVEHCVVDLAKGLFVDQKWCDLVPGLFSGVHLHTAPTYNVAYWNLGHRRIEFAGDRPTVRGEDLVFFHFSGFDPEDPGEVSKHQNRFTLADVGAAQQLYLDYRERLLAAGYRDARSWPYAFGRYADGSPIPELARSLYFSLGAGRGRFGDPFATGEGSFSAWAAGPARGNAEGPYLSRLLQHLWHRRSDLQSSFPEPAQRDLPRFARWLAEGGAAENRLAMVDLAGLGPLASPPPPGPAAAASTLRRAARSLSDSRAARQVKLRVKGWVGEQRTAALRKRLPGFLGGRRPPDPQGALDPLERLSVTRFGVNLAGYLTTESGMGEGARGIARALAAAGVPTALQNLELSVVSRREDRSFSGFTSVFDYDVNLFFVNADQVPHVADHLGRERFRGKLNIGFWLWELEEFPARWASSFSYFHEIWTASTFCLDAISAVSPIPVRRVGLPVDLAPRPPRRAAFGLPEEPFLFAFVFDFLSYLERKNPFAVVDAFKAAFASSEPVGLVLKTINGRFNPEGASRLAESARGWPITILDDYLDKDGVHDLVASTDAYVSLHRSEGFGLTLAEAMALGRPVVATAYSGNLDFMTPGNSYPVRYRLVEIDDDEGPYPKGVRWAEPDLAHAAAQMRAIFDDRDRAGEVGEAACRHIAEHHGTAATAAVLRRRLGRLLRQVNGPGGETFGL